MGRGVVDARVGGGSTQVPHRSRRGDIPHPRGLHWGEWMSRAIQKLSRASKRVSATRSGAQGLRFLAVITGDRARPDLWTPLAHSFSSSRTVTFGVSPDTRSIQIMRRSAPHGEVCIGSR
jgi:hypothetical protein